LECSPLCRCSTRRRSRNPLCCRTRPRCTRSRSTRSSRRPRSPCTSPCDCKEKVSVFRPCVLPYVITLDNRQTVCLDLVKYNAYLVRRAARYTARSWVVARPRRERGWVDLDVHELRVGLFGRKHGEGDGQRERGGGGGEPSSWFWNAIDETRGVTRVGTGGSAYPHEGRIRATISGHLCARAERTSREFAGHARREPRKRRERGQRGEGCHAAREGVTLTTGLGTGLIGKFHR
jgi:hypothetical protein